MLQLQHSCYSTPFEASLRFTVSVDCLDAKDSGESLGSALTDKNDLKSNLDAVVGSFDEAPFGDNMIGQG